MPRLSSDTAADASDTTYTALEAARASLNLPFYLYEGPDFDDGSWFERCARGLRGETVTEDQYSGEHYFLNQLRQHRWRTRSASSALLFVVPIYANAAMQPSVQGTSCNGTHFQLLLDRTAAAVAASEHYKRHQGADHVLVANSWKFAEHSPKQVPWSKLGQKPNDFFQHVFRNAIVGHMETRFGGNGFWRCSVVSPYTANLDADYDKQNAHLVPPSQRDVSFYFQGGANNRGTFGYAFRQAALAQLQDYPRAHISAFSLPGSPYPCGRGGVTTNCKAGRSNPAFRALMRRTKYNLILRGDSPSSRRLYDGIAVGAISVLVSDQLWSVGLPFGCLVPWRRFAFTLREEPFTTEAGARSTLESLDELSPQVLARMQRLANRHRKDILWNINGSRVAENLLVTAALRCLPSHVTRHRTAGAGGANGNKASRAASASSSDDGGAAGGGGVSGARGINAALKQLRGMCPYDDHSVTCREPDVSNCIGCETGDLAGSTPMEHCCGDSCPTCTNRTQRCVPAAVYYGDPLTNDPIRRQRLQSYLGQKDKELNNELQKWRLMTGRPKEVAKPKAKQGGGGMRPSKPTSKAVGKAAGKASGKKSGEKPVKAFHVG